MIVKNIYLMQKEWIQAHGGDGKINFCRPFETTDFESDLSFIDYVEVPPDSTIGYHQHSQNEEIYFIVDGKGEMRVNGETRTVTQGDLIVNKKTWKHAIKNTSNLSLKILVWETTIRS